MRKMVVAMPDGHRVVIGQSIVAAGLRSLPLSRFGPMLALLVLARCAAPPTLAPAPPPLPAETVPLPPVSSAQLVWHPGDWIFSGGSYRYDPGRYEELAGHSTTYVFGHWIRSAEHYDWVQGAWQSA